MIERGALAGAIAGVGWLAAAGILLAGGRLGIVASLAAALAGAGVLSLRALLGPAAGQAGPLAAGLATIAFAGGLFAAGGQALLAGTGVGDPPALGAAVAAANGGWALGLVVLGAAAVRRRTRPAAHPALALGLGLCGLAALALAVAGLRPVALLLAVGAGWLVLGTAVRRATPRDPGR